MSSPATPLLSPAAALEVRLEPAALATLRALSGEEDAEGVSNIRSVASDDSDDDDLSIESEDQGIIAIALEQSPPRTATLRLMTQLGGGRNSMPAVGSAPASAASGASGLGELTKLEIPSPNTFFAGLTSGSRHTWNAGQPASATPGASSPSSGAAERFYLAPWEVAAAMEPSATATSQYRKLWTSGPPVEHVVEVPAAVEDGANEPTARPPTTAVRVPDVPLASPGLRSNGDGLEAIEIILEADPVQARQQQSVALAQLDRMETWLAAQRAYLPTMMGPMDHVEESDTNEEEEEDDSADFYRQAMAATPPALLPPPPFRMSSGNNQPTDKPLPSLPSKEEVAAAAAAAAAAAVTTSSSSAPARKKSVRFSAAAKPAAAAAAAAAANNAKVPRELPATPYRQESAYYRAFVEHMIRQRAGDAYVHRQPRFEALQAQRATLRESHRRQLLGKFQLSVVPQSERQRRLSANVARGDDEPASPSDDDVARVRREQEAEAAEQMAASLWAVSAARMLAGGRLVRAPAAAARLARVSHMAPGPDSTPPRDRARILDLGGQASCDWAWHCAYAYPHTKIYTVTTRAARRLANSNMRGPPNHRTLAVDKLSRLPFADASFDLVSARELHALLKASGASGEDEWDACLAEVMRVLKPGGYLDFSLLDSDMISPGPRGLAKSVEFGFALKTLGYDPAPTRAFLGKLARAGFAEVRRAWTCLPMGPRPGACPMGVSPVDPAAADNGSAVAAVAGLAASWSWERWLLRAETEKLASERQLCAAETATSGDAVRDAAARCLGDVHAIVDEGRACGAAWRMLAGWARKPAAGEGVVA
jgi:SAM-dependent methyltransferase